MWAGPLCARVLGLAGLRVVKVESTGRPDGARRGHAGFFDWLHGGHESVALDLGSEGGRAALRRLVAQADVVVEASRPRALAQLGIDAEAAVAARPGTTWVSITGYGRSGPGAGRVAFGDDAAVAGGLVAYDAEGLPVFCADAVADPITGLHAAAAALASVAAGGGHLIDVPMAGAVAAACANPAPPAAAVAAPGPGARPPPPGTRGGPRVGLGGRGGRRPGRGGAAPAAGPAGGDRPAARGRHRRRAGRPGVLIAGGEVGGVAGLDVRVTGDEVTEVGAGLRREPGEEVVDARGGAIVPALWDHHVHLRAMAAARASVEVGPPAVHDERELAGALRRAAAAAPPDGWVRAVGYHESVAGPLDRWALDRLVPDRPLRVQHRSGALWVLNSAALAATGAADATEEGVERDDRRRPHRAAVAARPVAGGRPCPAGRSTWPACPPTWPASASPGSPTPTRTARRPTSTCSPRRPPAATSASGSWS